MNLSVFTSRYVSVVATFVALAVVTAIVLPMASADREQTAERLLISDALSRSSVAAPAWRNFGSNSLSLLCRELERDESTPARKLREWCTSLAIRFDIPRLNRPSPTDVRAAAALAIASIGPAASAAAKPLMTAVEHETEPIPRLAMIRALAQIGPAARDALLLLERLRQGADEEQIQAAREAVEAIQR